MNDFESLKPIYKEVYSDTEVKRKKKQGLLDVFKRLKKKKKKSKK